MKRLGKQGFTLIELMLVVAIIGLLAAIAIPKFADMIDRAKEAAIMGKLGSVRSAIGIYYSNNEGVYPRAFAWEMTAFMAPGTANIKDCLVPMYISDINSPARPPRSGHLNWPGGLETTNLVCGGGDITTVGPAAETGYWAYLGHQGIVCGSPLVGAKLVMACYHPDLRGVIWSTK